jgi:hypothetical protein
MRPSWADTTVSHSVSPVVAGYCAPGENPVIQSPDLSSLIGRPPPDIFLALDSLKMASGIENVKQICGAGHDHPHHSHHNHFVKCDLLSAV